MEHTTSDTRTEGLVRALVLAAGAGPHDSSIFGRWFGAKPKSAVDLLEFAVQPSKYNPRIPSNLYLVASAGKDSWVATTKLLRTSFEVLSLMPYRPPLHLTHGQFLLKVPALSVP